MAPDLLPRTAWTSVPRPTARLTRLATDDVRGIAVHWPGSSGTWGPTPTLEKSVRRLEAERRQHTSPSPADPTKPWADLAYSLAVDLAGRVFDGRGVEFRSAANGNSTVNARYVAITVLMAAGDTPTRAAVDALRWVRTELVLPRYPRAVEVVGHRDLHSTDCPGDLLYQLVRSGAFTSPPEDDMPLSDADLDAIADRVLKRFSTWPPPSTGEPDGREPNWQTVVGRTYSNTNEIIRRLSVGSPVLLTQAQVDAIADALAARLPVVQGGDPREVADAVRAELARALGNG